MYRVQWTGSELTIDPDKGGWSAVMKRRELRACGSEQVQARHRR
jgi:hypothetical protein